MTIGKPLKKKEIEQLHEILLEEKRKILHHLAEISDDADQEINMNSGDSADIASVEINQASLQKIGKREEALLKKIDLAIAKIADNTYGECEECGESIGFPRLMARPVAQLCIDCKTEQENVERKFSNKDGGDDEGDDVGDEAEEGE